MSRRSARRPIRNAGDTFGVEREPAILVGGYRPGELLSGEEPLAELERLADSAGAKVVNRVVQKIRRVHPGTYIGTGKVREIKALAERHKARCVIFDHDLTPAQSRNLDRQIGVKVVDRTDLILDVFASRAHTRMAKVQVNLALNEHRLPQLRRLWTHLERQTGGIGLRGGPGERQIETDRRKVLKTIHGLKTELKKMAQRKERMIEKRGRDHFLVSLVGYTNAGKSTLMRALTGVQVRVEDKLFATLDTKTATLQLGGGMKALLSDTVGFIRRLPHDLVASFHATLEEARSADLLLHVVDASSPHAREQMAVVDGVLKELGCAEKDRLLAFNKVDRLSPPARIAHGLFCAEYPQAVSVSALQGQGLEELKREIKQRARAQARPVSLAVPLSDGKTLAFLATHFFEESRALDGAWMILNGRATRPVLERLRGLNSAVRIRSRSEGPVQGPELSLIAK